MHQCSQCGATLVEGDQFCAVCGTAVTPPATACWHCHAPTRPGATFCPSCGAQLTATPVAAPTDGSATTTAPSEGRSTVLPWVLGAGVLVAVVLFCVALTLILTKRSPSDTATVAPPITSTTTAPATTTTKAPVTTTTTTTAPTTTEAPTTTSAPASDPVAALKNGVVTTGDGLRIQLRDGEGEASDPRDPTIRFTAYISNAERGARWPARAVVDISGGAGSTSQQIVVLDEAGQLRQSATFADRGSVQGLIEHDDGRVRVNYLERFPEDAMAAPGTIPAHATYDPAAGVTTLSPLAQPDAWCTASAGCMDTVGLPGFVSTEGYKVRSEPNRTSEVRYDGPAGGVFEAICITHGENVDGDDRWLISAVPHFFAWAPLFRLDTRFESGAPPGQAPPAPGGPAPEC